MTVRLVIGGAWCRGAAPPLVGLCGLAPGRVFLSMFTSVIPVPGDAQGARGRQQYHGSSPVGGWPIELVAGGFAIFPGAMRRELQCA